MKESRKNMLGNGVDEAFVVVVVAGCEDPLGLSRVEVQPGDSALPPMPLSSEVCEEVELDFSVMTASSSSTRRRNASKSSAVGGAIVDSTL